MVLLYLLLYVLVVFGLIVDPFGINRPVCRRALRCVLPGLALLCVAGLVCGGVRWYQTLGRIHETHTVDEYRFRITSERDPEEADAGECGEDISISIDHRGKVIVKRLHIGSITDDAIPPTLTVRRLPNESLIIGTPNAHEDEVVFVFDTANGECYPVPYTEDWRERDEQTKQRSAAFQTRIRACPGYEQHRLSTIWGIH